jgi:hypothetical protein
MLVNFKIYPASAMGFRIVKLCWKLLFDNRDGSARPKKDHQSTGMQNIDYKRFLVKSGYSLATIRARVIPASAAERYIPGF